METNASYHLLLWSHASLTHLAILTGNSISPSFAASNETAHTTMTSALYDVTVNETSGDESSSPSRFPNLVHTIVTSIVLGAIILATIVGNIFVIAAIVLERNLQNVANYLIASLSVADLMVAVLVMPLAAVKEVSDWWFLGKEICDMFVSCDVLCCTSSILHLVAISVDRYWAVTRVDYIHNRPVRLIVIMIGLSWGISTVISIPPLFGWRDSTSSSDATGECLISQDWGYTVYSTLGAFYIPLVIMLIIYLNVFRAARGRIRRKHFRAQESSTSSSVLVKKSTSSLVGRGRQPLNSCSTPPTVESPSTPSSVLTTFPVNGITTPPPPPSGSRARKSGGTQGTGKADPAGGGEDGLQSSASKPLTYEFNGSHWMDNEESANATQLDTSFRSAERRIREKKEQARERKAARTLAIITGSFVCCWLPFFILALVGPFCGPACPVPPLVVSVIGWLGYFNSLLNPVIYTIFNPDFRSAFRKILCGSYRNRQSISGKAVNASTSLSGSKKVTS